MQTCGSLLTHLHAYPQAHTAVHTAAAIARSCEPLPAQGFPTRQTQGGDQSAVQSMIMLSQHGLHARSRSWGTALTMTSVSMPSGHLAFAVQHESARAMTSLMMQHEPHQTAGQPAVAEARHPHGTSTRGMQLPAQLDRAGRAQPMSSGPRLALQPWWASRHMVAIYLRIAGGTQGRQSLCACQCANRMSNCQILLMRTHP